MDYEAERRAARVQYTNARAEAASAASQFLAATSAVVAEAYRSDVDRVAREQHGVTNALCEVRLKSLKQERNRLVEQAPENVRSALDRLGIWTYRDDDPPLPGGSMPAGLITNILHTRHYHTNPPRANDSSTSGLSYLISDALAAAMRPLNDLLKEYGYSGAAASLKLPNVTDPMCSLFHRYSAVLDAMYDALARLAEIDKTESMDKAAARWDQA
jgi:hypothetical protein